LIKLYSEQVIQDIALNICPGTTAQLYQEACNALP